jgi:hypothetical protein
MAVVGLVITAIEAPRVRRVTFRWEMRRARGGRG